MTEDDYKYGVRLSDGTMWDECYGYDHAKHEADKYNRLYGGPAKRHATVVRAPAVVWEEFE
jgi:hypothetical protein